MNGIISRLHTRVLSKCVDSVFRSFRIEFTAASKFFYGTHHAVGIYPAQLSCVNFDSALCKRPVMSAGYPSSGQDNRSQHSDRCVRSSCDNLDVFFSYIHLTND